MTTGTGCSVGALAVDSVGPEVVDISSPTAIIANKTKTSSNQALPQENGRHEFDSPQTLEIGETTISGVVKIIKNQDSINFSGALQFTTGELQGAQGVGSISFKQDTNGSWNIWLISTPIIASQDSGVNFIGKITGLTGKYSHHNGNTAIHIDDKRNITSDKPQKKISA